MRYSEIVGSACYGIRLSPEDYELVDIHFSGAAHHFYRWKEIADKDAQLAEFHIRLHRAHLRHLMSLIYERGDFAYALDPTLCDMDEKDSWNPDLRCIPDPEMFDDMSPDPAVLAGQKHLLDRYLKDKKAPITAPEILQKNPQFRVRRVVSC